MSDSLQTTVFVQYPPETIACACIYLAARVLQIPLPNRTHWFYLFNATEEDIQKICITLLCVYQTVKTPYEVLEKQVEACREVLMEEKLKAKEALGLGDSLAGSAANSPASRAASPKVSPNKDAKVQSSHRSSTVPTSLEDTKVVANGDKKHRRDDSKNRRSHDLGVKRSRTRSASGTRSSKYRKQSSSSQSSSEDSTPGDKNESRPGRSSDVLPKSYSNQNSNRYSDERRRHRRRKTDGKYRHSKSHRRDEKNEHKTRDGSHKRRESSLKKHKRKLSPDISPMPLSHVNGEKTSSASPSSKHRRHRSHRDSIRKKKTRHSASPSHRSRR